MSYNNLETNQLFANLSQNDKSTYYCQQRKLKMYFVTPTNRIEISSPYQNNNVTAYDLNMRRKIEILKYNNSTTTNQINSKLTKKQQYVNNTRNNNNNITSTNITTCNSISTPSSSADIPGPLTYLTLDKNVPLYNFKSHLTRNYEEIKLDLDYLIPPVIILVGSDITLDVGTEYIDPGAYSVNGETVNVNDSTVDVDNIGTYNVTYTTVDLVGLITTINRTVTIIDTIGPNIALIGNTTTIHERFSIFNDLGALLNDVSFSGISLDNNSFTANTNFTFTTGNIQSAHEYLTLTINCNLFDINTVGTYTLFYSGKDNSDNKSYPQQISRTVIVKDTSPPMCDISGLGQNVSTPFVIERFGSFDDPGIIVNSMHIMSVSFDIPITTISGNIYGGEIFTVTSTNDVIFNSFNQNYNAIYTITDADENIATLTRNIRVVDTTIPEVTLIGESIVQHETGNPYTDQGIIYNATGEQLNDNSINITQTTEEITVSSSTDLSISNDGKVDTVGTFTYTYLISDEVNNIFSISRTISVIDTTAPTIKLADMSSNNVPINNGSSISTPYAHERFENIDVDNLFYVNIDVSNNGTYSAYVDNNLSLSKDVNVDMSYNLYNDSGELSTDVARLTTTTSGIDISNVGIYQINYEVMDINNNKNSVTRYISIVDTTAPHFELNGLSSYNLTTGQTMVDPGIDISFVGNITVFDQNNYTISSTRGEIIIINRVITNSSGNIVNDIDFTIQETYTLTYTVRDNYNNALLPKVRTITTQDFSVILNPYNQNEDHILGDNSLERFINSYVEPGVLVNNISYNNNYQDSNITVTITNNIDISNVKPETLTNTDQSYNVIYDITDNIGNSIRLFRYVQVRDRILPSTSLNGDENIVLVRSSTFNDGGVTIEGIVKMNANNNNGGTFTSVSGENITFLKTITLLQRNPTQFPVGFSWTIYDGFWYDRMSDLDTLPIIATDKTINYNRSTSTSNRYEALGQSAGYSPHSFYEIIDDYYMNGSYNMTEQTIEVYGTFCPLFSGTYKFYTASDDSSYLWIGNNAAYNVSETSNATVNNGGQHTVLEKSGNVTLEKGKSYPLRVLFGANLGGTFFSFYFQYENNEKIYLFNDNSYSKFNTELTTNTNVSFVDTSIPDTSYNISYTIRDEYPTHKAAGATFSILQRNVQISNTDIGNISMNLNGSPTINYEFINIQENEIYQDAGLTISGELIKIRNEGSIFINDYFLTIDVVVKNVVNTVETVVTKVDMESLGEYKYTYTVRDEYNNSRNFVRTINISNNSPPNVILNGETSYTIVLDSTDVNNGLISNDVSFTEPGIRVTNFRNPYNGTEFYAFGVNILDSNSIIYVDGIIYTDGIEDTTTGEPLRLERTIYFNGIDTNLSGYSVYFSGESLGTYTFEYKVTNLANNLSSVLQIEVTFTEQVGTYVVYWELFKLKQSYNSDNNATSVENAIDEAYGRINNADGSFDYDIEYYLGDGDPSISGSNNDYDIDNEYTIFNKANVPNDTLDNKSYNKQLYLMYLPRHNGIYNFEGDDDNYQYKMNSQYTMNSWKWKTNSKDQGITIHFPHYFKEITRDRNYPTLIDYGVDQFSNRYQICVIFEFDSRNSPPSKWEEFKGDASTFGIEKYYKNGVNKSRIDWWFYDRNPNKKYRWFHMTYVNAYRNGIDDQGNGVVNEAETWFIGVMSGEKCIIRPRNTDLESALSQEYSISEMSDLLETQSFTGFDMIYPYTGEQIGGQIYRYETGPKHFYRHKDTNQKFGEQIIGWGYVIDPEYFDVNEVINTT